MNIQTLARKRFSCLSPLNATKAATLLEGMIVARDWKPGKAPSCEINDWPRFIKKNVTNISTNEAANWYSKL